MSKSWNQISLILVSLLLFIIMGCGSDSSKTSTNESSGASKAPASSAAASPEKEKPTEISLFMVPDGGNYINNLSESLMVQELEKRTNTKLTFIHPPGGQGQEQFNLMVASNDLPDVVMGFFDKYKGGASQAVKDGLIIDPTNLINAENTPNLLKLIEADPMIAKLLKNDDGEFIGFGARISNDFEIDKGLAMVGPQIRKDLLDKLGLPIPETVDDWYNVLTAFKNNFPELEAPLGWSTMNGQFLASAYDVMASYKSPTQDFFVKDGKVRYSSIEPGYREYLTTMNKWYEEGLLHRDFATQNYSEHILPMMQSGKIAAAPMHLYWYAVIKDELPEGAELVNAPIPVLEKGQQLHIRPDFGWGVKMDMAKYISTSNKHPVETMKFLDYLYSDEGKMLTNWGIEGESYEIVNGEPQFTEMFMSDQPKYGATYSPNPMKQRIDMRMDLSQYPLDIQHQAWELWGQADISYLLPLGISFTSEETALNTKVLTDVTTYRDEMFLKFVMGVEPLNKFDDFVKQIKAFGIDEVTANYDRAIDRLAKR